MNQLLARRYEKKVMGYGVPKYLAKEIVQVAMETSKDDNLDKAIAYALDLTYGLGFTKKLAQNN